MTFDLINEIVEGKRDPRTDRRVFLPGRTKETVYIKAIVVPEREFDEKYRFQTRGAQRFYELLFEHLPVAVFNHLAEHFHKYYIHNLQDDHGDTTGASRN